MHDALDASLDEQAEGVTRRVEVDANVVLWLEVGQCCPNGDRVRYSLIQVVNVNVQVQHLLLFPGSFRPYRGPIVRLGLERQVCPPSGHLSRTQSGSLRLTSHPRSLR